MWQWRLTTFVHLDDATLRSYLDNLYPTTMTSKRRRNYRESSEPTQINIAPASVRSVFAYDEIFLRIMSFLSPTDLAVVQGVSKHWARISLDPQVSLLVSYRG
jgi:hypothetical protein